MYGKAIAGRRAVAPGAEDSTACGITLCPRRFGRLLLVAAVGLSLASIASQFILYYTPLGSVLSGASGGVLRVFYSNNENSIPTWFSIVSLLLCSALLFVIAWSCRARRDRFAPHWLGLAVLFFLLSIDEGASIHELASRPLRELFGAGGWLYYSWVIPGALFVAAFAAVYARFLRALPLKTRILFAASGVTFIAGVIGMELIGGWHVARHGPSNMSFALLTAVEECLEMLGTGLFVYALLDYMERHVETFAIEIGRTQRLPAGEPVEHRSRIVAYGSATATVGRRPEAYPAGSLHSPPAASM